MSRCASRWLAYGLKQLAIRDGVGAVGAAFVAVGVLVAVVGLCVDQAWLLKIDIELHGTRICMHTWPCLFASASW